MADVKLVGVWKLYREEKGPKGLVEAAKDVNLDCPDKSFVAFLGPSGCGKTSTLRMIAGLERISRGSIFIGGRRVNDLTPQQRNIAMAFESYALYPPLSVYDNIAFPLRARKVQEARIKEVIMDVASLLQIENILDQRPARLSGGEQQRVSLARALVREEVAVTLMDEPISHLDAQLKSQLRVEIKRLQRERGLTVIYVTHDQLEALSMADRVAVMNAGEVQQVGTPEEIYNQPANLFVAGFVGEPPMNFIECSLEVDCGKMFFTNPWLRLELPAYVQEMIQSTEETPRGAPVEWVLGIRPTDLFVVPEETCANGIVRFKGEVYASEPLGESTVLSLKVDREIILTEVPGTLCLRPGEPLGLGFHKDRLHVFNKATGKAVRTGGAIRH